MSLAPSQRPILRTLALGLLILAPGCGPTGNRSVELAERADSRPAPVVDSILPIEEELRRFREGTVEVTELRFAARSKEELIETLMISLQGADTTAVASLALTRDEFAWLYFPHAIYTAPPYELPPGLVWYQQQNRSSRGLTRLLRRYAGRELHYTGIQCPDDGQPFGEGHIWHGCVVLGELPTGMRVEERLFGSVLEVGGRFKLVSFSNEL